jgi:hypothetical protein
MVNSLIYYYQTHKFFDKYYGDIIYIYEELECSGLPIKLNGVDIKNAFAWACFEHVAYKIATEDLGLFQ